MPALSVHLNLPSSMQFRTKNLSHGQILRQNWSDRWFSQQLRQKGHLDQERKNLQSTKPPSIPPTIIQNPDMNLKTRNVICAIETFSPTQRAYTYLTGHFP